MFVLSREEMYFLDKYTIEKIGIPGKELMEKAGRGCSEFIKKKILLTGNKVALFCGSGNNGGDGFVIARYLRNWNYVPVIFLVGNTDKMSPETLENFNKCKKLNITIHYIKDFNIWKKLEVNLVEFDLIVDAIFGVGFKGIMQGWLIDLVKDINKVRKTVVAVDISSGTDANTGRSEIAVKADYTLTMAAYKYGHFLGKGRENSGKTIVIDIGISEKTYKKFPPKARLITEKNVLYPERSLFSHKGDYGKTGIIAGSFGFSGAAIMACRSALRAGAGLIKLYHPKGMETIFETQLLEVMTHPVPEDSSGNIDFEQFSQTLSELDAILIGPGIGTSEKMKNLLGKILKNLNKPLILDADAINILAENQAMLNFISGRLLTPHIGEFARLIKKSVIDIINDPVKELEEFNQKYKSSVLLKSATTIFSDGEELIFDISGNDGLSTGGSGDVLAGIIISFSGQGMSFKDSAISASYLLGKTAEKLAEIRKPASIIPSDIIEELFKY